MSSYMGARAHIALAGAVITAAVFADNADASLIHIESQSENSTEGLGSLAGTIEYVPDAIGGTQGLLTINLINTTNVDIGGFITGFVFNIGSSDQDAIVSLTSATHPFVGVMNHPAPPFGDSFDAGAALGGNWTGGGNPNPGITIGETGTFVFDVIASDADLLTAESFLTGPLDHNFVVRFRGMENGGSDKVSIHPFSTVPAPGALAMLLSAGIVASRRRKR